MTVIEVTDAAINQLKEIAKKEDKDLRLRIMLRGGGCSGVNIDMNFTKWPHDAEHDQSFKINGVEFIIDNKSALFLQGATLDYGGGLLDTTFKWDIPKSTGGCGCGMSFSF